METQIKSVRGECFPFAPLDTPRYARHSGRTGNVSHHSLGFNLRFPRVGMGWFARNPLSLPSCPLVYALLLEGGGVSGAARSRLSSQIYGSRY
jgi:hypothetical protein